MYDKLMARHKTVNQRFKEWSFLQKKFCHDKELHSIVSQAIAALTQLQIENGSFVWEI